MADPVRLYNPNPDAPNVWGAPPTKRSPLAEVLASVPSPYDVFSPPAAARQSYGSLARTMVDMTAPAATRDTVDASGQTMDALTQGRGWDAAGGVANMLTAAAGVVPGGRLITKGAQELAKPIRAYHGSPHDFDKFDLSKIGTGEGAQAYGHGLYFAGREDVAKGYRDQLSSPTYKTQGGELFDPQSQLQHMNVRVAAHRNGPDLDATIARAEQLLPKAGEQTRPMIEHDIAVLRSFKDAGGIKNNPGHMYEVNIHADPNKFLDWDKPLSGQTPNVQGALRDIGFKREFELVPRSFGGEGYTLIRDANGNVVGSSNTRAKALENAHAWADPAGPAIYGDINKSAPEATNALREAGIPGIKYLDGGSRAAGDGSRNYVAFDDKLIEILRKYGFPPLAVGGAVAAAGQQPEEGAF